MSALAPTVQAWFTEHLLTQRQASPRSPVVVLRYLFDPGWCAVSW